MAVQSMPAVTHHHHQPLRIRCRCVVARDVGKFTERKVIGVDYDQKCIRKRVCELSERGGTAGRFAPSRGRFDLASADQARVARACGVAGRWTPRRISRRWSAFRSAVQGSLVAAATMLENNFL